MNYYFEDLSLEKLKENISLLKLYYSDKIISTLCELLNLNNSLEKVTKVMKSCREERSDFLTDIFHFHI